jgi:probable rRNA maturation factor
MSRPDIAVAVVCPAWTEAVPKVEEFCRRAAAAALKEAARPPRRSPEISLVLGDDDLLRRLNRQYRGRDEPTNVLSFATGEDGAAGRDEGPRLLGDVIVAYQTTVLEAARDDKTTDQHLAHLVVHGVLHLLGYDHRGEAEAEAMEDLERTILDHLGIPDPYAPRDIEEGHDEPT